MQFHLTKIQLCKPFAFHQARARPSTGSRDGTAAQLAMTHISERCRALGASSAIRIAKLFATFRRKYDVRCLQCSGVQYASIAARFLVKYIPLLAPDEVVEPEAHLQSLVRTLEDMSQTFKPALEPLDESASALKALEKRVNMERSPPYGGEPSLLGRSYSSSSTRPPLDDLDLAPGVLLAGNGGGETDLSPVDSSGKLVGHPSRHIFEDEELEVGLSITPQGGRGGRQTFIY